MTDPDPGRDIWTRVGPYRMTWSDFGVLVERLSAAVRADGFRPDVLCCIARGGFVVAGYLALALDVERLHVVRVRRTVDDRTYADKHPPRLRVATDDELRREDHVLVVDDIVGTGVTADLVDGYVRQASGDSRFAALLHNPGSHYRPDYAALQVDDWVVFPWERGEASVTGRPLDLGPRP